MMIFLLFACITEQECDECFEYAQFYKNCAEYLRIQNETQLPCFKEEIIAECICSSDDLYASESDVCYTEGAVGSFKEDLNVCSLSYLDYQECNFFDAYGSCREIKKALNISDQRLYYSSQSCRRWFWENESAWEVEKTIEKEQCEEFINSYDEESWLLFGIW